MSKVVVACAGVDDLVAIQQLSRSGEVEVIAVALDVGAGRSLRELHDSARGAGAARCHALDVREEFAHECVLPAIDAETMSDGVDEVQARAREFIAKKLAAVAALEGDVAVLSASTPLLPFAPRHSTPASIGRSAHVDIVFQNGVPVSLNGISMSLVEVLDSLATIAAAHGVNRPGAALSALQAGHRALGSGASAASGTTRLEIFQGAIRVVEPEYAAS